MDKTKMSKESAIEQLASIDFSSPVDVNVVFEDDEEEVIVKKEKTETEENFTKSTEENVPDEIYLYNDTHVHKNVQNKEIKIETQVDFAAASSQSNTFAVPIKTVAGLTESKQRSTNVELNNNKNLKRKINEEGLHESKMCRKNIENNTSEITEHRCQQKNPICESTFIMQEDPPNNVTNDLMNADSNSNPEMTCISNLLQSVSKHLILIMDAYSRYVQLKGNKAATAYDIEKYNSEFCRVKYHLFNLSFCTVDTIILPQEKNIFFTGKFLQDTVKLALSENRVLCLETQVAPLFMELLQWSKQKKLQINNLPIVAFHSTNQIQSNPLLIQQLKEPVKPFLESNASLKVPSNNLNTSANSQEPRLHTTQINIPNKSTSLLEKTNQFPNNYNQRLPSGLNHVPNESSGLLADLNKYVQRYGFPNETNSNNVLTAQRKDYHTTNDTVVPNTHPAKKTGMHQGSNWNTQQSYVPQKNKVDGRSVVFSSGPPGRQISITVEQSILQSTDNHSMTNSTAPTQSPKNIHASQNYSSGHVMPHYNQSLNRTTQNYEHIARQNPVITSYLQGHQNMLKPTPNWQRDPPDYYRAMEKRQMPPAQPLQIQTDQQSPEVTRSLSTDSGFMSPLNFNNSSETNRDVDQSLPSPVITHITSLHPEVSYLSEGLCFVCGKVTRKMCVGCYKRYYCSHLCQRYDWNVHQAMCRKT